MLNLIFQNEYLRKEERASFNLKTFFFFFFFLRLSINYQPDSLTTGFYIHLKEKKSGVPVMVQWLANPTGNHEVAGSVPALVQWVDDPALQ